MPSLQPPPLNRPRIRAVTLGLALVIGLAFLMPYVNMSLRTYDWAFRPLPTGPVFVLFLLVWPANALLRRHRPRWAFTGAELLLVYAMMAIGAPLHYEGLWGYATDYTVYPSYAASPENRWGELILPHLPTWLQITEPEAVAWFFDGAPEGARFPWSEWLRPVAGWSAFALALYAFLFCLGCCLRKDWIEAERLAFPIAALPIEMTADQPPSTASQFFRTPWLWVGIAFPVAQGLLQMAHSFAPAIPYSRLYFPLGRYLAGTGPWESLSDTVAYIGFDTIGIFCLLPVEVSLSLWLFFVINRLEIVGFAAAGYGQEGIGARLFSPAAFISYQEAGGCIMLAILLLWGSRRALSRVFRALFDRTVQSDALDPISPRSAALGLLFSSVVLIAWAQKAGMDLWVFIAVMAIFFAYSLSMSRLVAASGIYVPDVSLLPRDFLVCFGAARYSAPSLTILSLLQAPFMYVPKVNMLHFSLNDFKVLHSARIPGRLAGLCVIAAVALMMAIVPWVDIYHAYRHGAMNFDLWLYRDTGSYEFGKLAGSLRAPEAPLPYLPLGLLVGAAVMFGLTYLHMNFVWWGLSPIGFIMGGTWGMGQRMWTNAFIAWLVVVTIQRFGGLRLYAKVRPLFLGLILGSLVMLGFRSLVDPLLGLHQNLAAWG